MAEEQVVCKQFQNYSLAYLVPLHLIKDKKAHARRFCNSVKSKSNLENLLIEYFIGVLGLVYFSSQKKTLTIGHSVSLLFLNNPRNSTHSIFFLDN